MTGKGSCEGPEQLQADAGKDWKMSYYRKTIVPNIEAHYENLSAVEKNIADFFISNEDPLSRRPHPSSWDEYPFDENIWGFNL